MEKWCCKIPNGCKRRLYEDLKSDSENLQSLAMTRLVLEMEVKLFNCTYSNRSHSVILPYAISNQYSNMVTFQEMIAYFQEMIMMASAFYHCIYAQTLINTVSSRMQNASLQPQTHEHPSTPPSQFKSVKFYHPPPPSSLPLPRESHQAWVQRHR
jgi:hypothetical protein